MSDLDDQVDNDELEARAGIDPPAAPPPPPKHSKVRALAQELDITVEQLASRFGISLRTIYKWEERGCPFTTIDVVRAWAADSKISLRSAPDAFVDVLPSSAPNDGDSPGARIGTKSAPSTPAGQETIPLGEAEDDEDGGTATAASGGAKPTSAAARLADASTILKHRQIRMADIEIARNEDVLILKEDVEELLKEIGSGVIAELRDLPGLTIKGLSDGFPYEHRSEVRKAILASVEEVRSHIVNEIRARFARLKGRRE